MTGMGNGAEPGWTIRCDEVVELITDYLEGTLDPGTAAELEAHLALCTGCAEYLTQMRQTLRTVGSIPRDTLSEQARTDLLAAFRDLTR
jgi:anti-sigma factor RsiW